MATFTCEKCGHQFEARCKPKKCPQCGELGGVAKVDAPTAKPKSKGAKK